MKTWKRITTGTLITTVLLVLTSLPVSSQGVGIAFSYFFPKNGSFSAPVMPVSLNDISVVSLGKYLGVKSSISLYSIGGMSLKDIQDINLSSSVAVIGPFNSFAVTLAPQLRLRVRKYELKLSAGGFAYYNINPGLLTGNFDRALAEYKNWDALTSDIEAIGNQIGGGYVYGGTLTYYLLVKRLGITMGVNLYSGGNNMTLTGTYIGGVEGSNLVEELIEFKSKLDYSGTEFLLGVTFILKKPDNN
ncbi:MAG: hypothetical protein IIA45_12420 [Bacteroidetes bacterium]|nr:hypothetical protein [Bacteroidota bacterium]